MDFETIKEMARQRTIKFLGNEHADGAVFKLIMAIFITAILVGALIPTSLTAVINSRNGSWTASVLNTYDAIPILIAVCVVAVLAGIAYKAFND